MNFNLQRSLMLNCIANSNINNMFITNKANPGWPNINSIFGASPNMNWEKVWNDNENYK